LGKTILTYQKNHLFPAGADFVPSPLELWFSLFPMPRFSASSLFLQRRDCKVDRKHKLIMFKKFDLSPQPQAMDNFIEASTEALQ